VRRRVVAVDGRVTPPFPGGVGVSHLRVYDTAAPDGLAGGTPHVHTVCTEAYAVIAGRGSVQTLTASGYDEVPLEPGAFVWFTPGTIHRLVNGGDLEILVLMGNAGLPEAGDMVITLPPEVVSSAEAYEAAAVLPEEDRTTAGTGAGARRRRDLAVPEFGRMVRAAGEGDLAPLRAFHSAAAALVRPRLDGWTAIWRDGPKAAVDRTGEQLAALAAGVADHLDRASVHRLPPPPEERRWGCCGTLGTYVVVR
jgi:mannose-6-phosphate isomerase-like protein (cupin superfamily)